MLKMKFYFFSSLISTCAVVTDLPKLSNPFHGISLVEVMHL